jgi:hypothetical protein
MKKGFFKRILAVVLSAALLVVCFLEPVALTTEAVYKSINHAPMAPSGLLTNESEHPMNVESAPLFDWWVNDEDYDEVQTAYQIRLYDDVTEALVWDSGKVNSANQNCVAYGGEILEPGHPYSWEVRTWDKAGEASPYSERARFATGLGNENNRISLAIYDQKTDKYLVGVELDTDAFKASSSCLERDVYKPRFLESRGWTIVRVWCRDWWLYPSKVVKHIAAIAEKNRKP